MSRTRITLFLLSLFVGLGWASAQNRTVTGVVTSSEDKLPIIQANVVVVGNTSIGVATDFEGRFKIQVPASAKQLRFTYIGMKELVLNIEPVMNVVMHPDTDMLDAVVVIGYGSGQKLGTVTGSVARVSGEKLENKPVANVMDALQGQVSGMNVSTGSGDPNAIASVTIHGNASLGASSAPLYIVDGVQTAASLVQSMNPNDFESYTVLKDASSTSIYGSRAANGVIVITTKKGKKNQDGRIVVNAMYGVARLLNKHPKAQMMTGQELVDYQIANTKEKDLNLFLNRLENSAFDGIVDRKAQKAYVGRDYDWLDVHLGKLAPIYQADMSISGGSDNISYYISGGYLSQESITRSTSYFNKLNLRSNIDARVKEWMRIGVNLSGGVTNRYSSRGFGMPYVNAGTFGGVVTPPYYSPYKKIKDENGNEVYSKEYNDITNFVFNYPALVAGRVYMPEFENKFSNRSNVDFRLGASGYAQFTPIKGLTLKSQLGIEYSTTNFTWRGFPDHPESAGLGDVSRQYAQNHILTWTNTAEYKWRPADDHDLTFLAGHEYVASHSEGFDAYSRGQVSRDYMFIQMGQKGDYLTIPKESMSDYAYLSFFGRVNYSYSNWISADATVRHDRSSRFGKNHQGGTFFSLGGLFNIKNLYLKDHELISTLALKANYGTQGNSGIPLYAHEALTGTIYYTDRLAFGVTTIGNPNLKWETQGMANVGVDFGFWEDHLLAGINYYNRKTYDMLMDVPLPYSTGYSSRYENVGQMTNQGLDIDLTYTFLDTKDWNAYVRTSFTYNWNRVDKLHTDLADKEGWKAGRVYYKTGKPRVLNMPEFAGYDCDGNQMWYVPEKRNADGTVKEGTGVNPKTGDRYVTTKYSADLEKGLEYALIDAPFFGGLSLGATWKNQISLVLDFTYQAGAYCLNNDRFFYESNVRGFMLPNKSKKLLDAWTPTNTVNARANKFDDALQTDDRLLEKTDYFRLKNLTLSYMFPKSLFENTKVIHGAKVYFTGSNLFTIMHKSYNGFDPEASFSVSRNNFPATMQFVGGVQLTF